MGVRLPAEYQEVEYLEGQGAQWILTDIPQRSVYRAKYKIQFTGHASDTQQIFASHATGSIRIYFPYITGGSWAYGYDAATSINVPVVANTVYSVDCTLATDNQTISINDNVVLTSTNPTVINDSSIKFGLFASSNRSSPRYAYARIYYFDIFDTTIDTQIAGFVPCYRKSDSEPGMYDLVSKTFYANQGTGEFLVGPDVVNHISPRLMDRRRALITKLTSLFRKVITSQTGLVSFDTNVAKPMKVTCEFSPKQDLHGYDTPWPAGGGKNLFDESTLFDIASYPISGSYGYYYANDLVLKPNTAYVVSATGTAPGNNINYYFTTASGSGSCYIITSGSINTYRQLTTGEDGIIRIGINKGDCASYQDALDAIKNNAKIQLEEGSTATAYAPYKNICPIEAWDGANIEHTGKNLFDFDDVTYPGYGIQSDGMLGTVQNTNAYVIKCRPNTSYTLTKQYGSGISIGLFKTYPVLSSRTTVRTGLTYYSTYTFNTDDYEYIVLAVPTGITDKQSINLVYGSAATDYEPYQGTTIPITFNNPGTYDFLPIQAGTGDPSPENIRPITPGLTFTRDDSTTLTVWGGSLTVNADGTGTITSKYYQCVYDGVNKKVNSSYLNNTYIAAGDVYCNPDGKFWHANDDGPLFSDRLTVTSPYVEAFLYQLSRPAAGRLYLIFKVGLVEGSNVTNASECIAYVNNWLQNNPTSVAYKLLEADYQTYTLSVAETSRAFEALGLGKNLGPLYGGTVTVNEDGSVDVVGDMASVTITSVSNYPYRKLYSAFFVPTPTMASGNGMNGYASWLPTTINQEKDYPSVQFGWNDNPNRIYLWRIGYVVAQSLGIDVTNVTAAQVNQYLEDNPLNVVYPLATPQIYHFSSIGELQSFLGTNNIWSDLNGPITVEYYKKQQ